MGAALAVAATSSVASPAAAQIETPPASEPASPEAATPEPAPPEAESSEAQAEDESVSEDEAKPEKKKKKKKKSKRDGDKPKKHAVVSPAGRAEIKGRLIARSELRAQRGYIVGIDGKGYNGLVRSFDLSVPSARISLHYEAPMPWLTSVVEFELASKPLLKDGYAQARLGDFQLRAGQFKIPTAPHESVSPFTLPTVHRGFISSLLTDWLDVGGRRPGVMVGYHPHWALRPSLSLGAFQGGTMTELVYGERDTDLIEFKTMNAQSLVARAQIESKALALGAWYEYRLGSPSLNVAKRYSAAGADLTYDGGEQSPGLRAWLSGVVGEGWYRHSSSPVPVGGNTVFATGRLLAAYRIFGAHREEFYLEPFGLVGLFDPDLKLSKDFALEAAVGLNIGLWRRARVTLQYETVLADTYFPKGGTSYLGGEEARRQSLFAQVMLVF